MPKVYIYPITSRNNTGINNPYIDNLAEALGKHFSVLNRDLPSNKGVFDLFKYIRETDYFLLNWIEDLPDKHMGFIQCLVFFILFPYIKIRGKKIVWTLHNKKSHTEKNTIIKSLLFKMLLNGSDAILTHAQEGLNSIPEGTSKVYFPHPVKSDKRPLPSSQAVVFDIIIWGSIAAYKGIDSFLEFIRKNHDLNKYNILIAGKIIDDTLQKYLEQLSEQYNNITVLNRFIENAELDQLILKSKIILFSYHTKSVLSSGALMDSLFYGKVIIGPDAGAFKDLAEEKIVLTYGDYPELMQIIDQVIGSEIDMQSLVRRTGEFLENNTWESFARKFQDFLRNQNP